MKKILLVAFTLFSVSMFAQNLPSAQVWGNTKFRAFTSASDSSGFITLDQVKTYTTAGLNSGTVTSVALTVPTGLSVSGSPITSSGTFAITSNMAAGYVSSAGVGGALTSSATIPSTAITGVHTVAQGGTGAGTLTGYVKGNGTSAMTASSTIPTTDLSGTVTNAQLANSTITGALTATGTDLTFSSSTALGGTLTLNVPSASATARGVITTGAQTLAGDKTFSGDVIASGGVVLSSHYVSTPSALTGATTLTTASNHNINADATTAAFTITLPTTPAAGTKFIVTKKNSTTNYITVTRGGTNTIAGNVSHVIVSKGIPTVFEFDGTSEWYVSQ